MAGFYNCEFIETPPQSVQTDCPVCLSVLRDPYQSTCCGHSFCKACIEEIKADYPACPSCYAEDFDTFEDEQLRRSLYAFKVRCPNKQRGCEWEGELGQLEKHLNANPSPSQILEQLKGCQFIEIKCLHCAKFFQRSQIQTHQSNQCPSRPTVCMYCDKYCSNNEDVTTNHWSLCAYYPENCPNKCGKILQRQNLAVHVSSSCPLAEVDCDFKEVGCHTTLLRKEMATHLSENVTSHLSLMASSHAKLQTTVAEQDQLLKKFELSNERLQQRTVKLNQALETVKQNAVTLQQKLSKRDESLTQHLKSLQQQLAEETKRSKRDDAKLVRLIKQHQLDDEKKENQKAYHKFPVPGVVVFLLVSVFLLYVVAQPLMGQCTAQMGRLPLAHDCASSEQTRRLPRANDCAGCEQTGSLPRVYDCAGSELSAICTCTLQPLNSTNIVTVCSIEGDTCYGLPFCAELNAGDCNVKFVMNSSIQNGKVPVDLMPEECNRLRSQWG